MGKVSEMQHYYQHPQTMYNNNAQGSMQTFLNSTCVIPTQNRFEPLSEWVGMSLNTDTNMGQMEIDAAQNKRRRCNTGADSSFASLSVDDKLLHMFQKLENLEQSNRLIHCLAQGVNETKGQVQCITRRADTCTRALFKSVSI